MNGSMIPAWPWALYSKPEKKNLQSRIIGTRLGLRGGGASRRTKRFDLIYVLSELICAMCYFFFVSTELMRDVFPLCTQHECSTSCYWFSRLGVLSILCAVKWFLLRSRALSHRLSLFKVRVLLDIRTTTMYAQGNQRYWCTVPAIWVQ